MCKDEIAHVSHELWEQANQIHIAKIISEFAHESIIQPVLKADIKGWGYYELTCMGDSEIVYHFQARILEMNHWFIKRGSVEKYINGRKTMPESLYFILEFQDVLDIDKSMLPSYLEEITSTLYGSMYMLKHRRKSAKELARADYQTLEHAMFSGHPIFVANNGRIGFDSEDYRKYAPEADSPVKLIWLAGHKSRTAYNAIESISYQKLLKQELGDDIVQSFNQQLSSKDLNPEDYVFIPVHPWQWYNKLVILFAPDIAINNLVFLGTAPDDYYVQQSLRTFYNISNPEKFYTKTSLSILNMGFVRGLSPYYMDTTPAITNWIKETIGNDPYIKSFGFTMLCEVATVGYRNFYFEGFGQTSHYNKMLAALWRESPASVISKGQQLMTMAALLHVDPENDALLPEVIKASGRSTSDWLRSYLRCYLTPLLHCYYEHDLSFMPHGENVILVMENHVPVKVIMKDITEEVGVFNPDAGLPEKAKRIYLEIPEDIRILNIFIDIFDGFFRFLTQILDEYCQLTDQDFWKLVAECIHQYQNDNPHLQKKFNQMDLFVPEFTLSCLNRLQLRNNKQMLNTADPLASLQFVGKLQNPICKYKQLEMHSSESLSATV